MSSSHSWRLCISGVFIPMLLMGCQSQDNKGVACPPILTSASTQYLPSTLDLCGLSLRYQKSLTNLKALGLSEPLRIADVMAPRFIEQRDWLRAKTHAPGTLHPESVYDPAPATWRSWDEAQRSVAQKAKENQASGRIPEVKVSRILELHRLSTAYQGGPFGLRETSDEIGRAFEEYYSVDDQQVKRFGALEYGPLLTWHNTLCLEERAAEFQGKFRADLYAYTDVKHWAPTKDPRKAFINARGERRRCGYIQYLDHRRVPAELSRWERELNRDLAAIPTKAQDPILLAARAQRWLVAIHPFLSGNGRVSRLLMDEILQALGLPAPLLENMNEDLGHSEAEWAREIGAGMVRTVEVLEACVKSKLQGPYCREI